MFSGCTNLKSIIIPENITKIGTNAFENCMELIHIYISNNVTTIGKNAFSGCYIIPKNIKNESELNLESYGLVTCDEVTENGFCIKDNILLKYIGNDEVVIIPKNVNVIGENSFNGYTKLSSILFHDDVQAIEGSAFANCSSLVNIDFPNKLFSIGKSTFSNCISLKKIIIPDSIKIIEKGTFSGCKNLISVLIPNKVEKIGDGAFSGCTSLTDIVFPDVLTNIGNSAFSDCTSLYNIKFPYGVTTIGNNTFKNCIMLVSIEIPSSVTSIGYHAFSGCYMTKDSIKNKSVFDLESFDMNVCDQRTENGFCIKDNMFLKYLGNESTVQIPKGITYIKKSAFSNCTSVTSIIIPDGVNIIDDVAFSGCSVEHITIPGSVVAIGQRAFYLCNKLTSIAVKANCFPKFGYEAFSPQTLFHATLLIPVGTWYDYAYDDYWYAFHTIRETAFETDETSNARAFTMKMANDNNYLCYDKVNDAIGTVNIQGLDENEPNNTWMTMSVDGKQYIYNLGAKKYLAKASNNAKARRVASSNGSYILTDEPTPINISNGEDGIKVGDAGEFYFVMNDNLNVDNSLASEIQNYTAIETVCEDEASAQMYNLSGQRVSNDYRGIVVKNGVKVMNK